MTLPIFHSDSREMSMLQTKWSAQINPILSNVLMDGVLTPNQTLINGTTQVSHRLGRKPLGWIVTRQRASAIIYDSQDSNLHPDLTLSLVSNALVIVDLYIF